MNLSKNFINLFIISFTVLTSSIPAEAGIISILSKLGNVTNKVDAPDVNLPHSFHFKEAISNLSDGSAAEISIVNGRWLAKMPDGKRQSVDEFVDSVHGGGEPPTLVLAESNVPKSFSQFNSLPQGLAVKIISRNGKVYSLNRTSVPATLKYQNIELVLSDSAQLDSILWQLQRPSMTQQVRFVRLAKDVDAKLPSQVYGSKPAIDTVGMNNLIKSIKNMRLETMVLSGKVKGEFFHHDERRISMKQLEQAAASRDVNLIILGTDKPKNALQGVADSFEAHHHGIGTSDSVADFYNRFAPVDVITPMRIKVTDSGELQTAIHLERKAKVASRQAPGALEHVAAIPLHLLLVESVRILQPNKDRVKELDRRIFPAVSSSIQLYTIVSFFSGIFFAGTSWFLYLKLWRSPARESYSNTFYFCGVYVLHRLSFILLYLPILGFFSPFHLIVRWIYAIINTLLFKPLHWLISKLK